MAPKVAATAPPPGQPERKRRKRRDKEKPKRAMSAYLVFLNNHREALQKKNPNASVTDITKTLALKWKNVSAAERAECQRKADEDKARYYAEMRNYVPLPDEKEDEPPVRYDKDGNRKRRKKDKNAPRKNRSAYIIWAKEYRDSKFRPKAGTKDAVPFRQQAAELGEQWKKLSAKEKAKYEAAAKLEAQEYVIKRDAYLTEKKNLSLAAREAKRQRLLDEKRAWEAAKEAAAQLRIERKKHKAAEKERKDKEKSTKGSTKSLPKTKKSTAGNMDRMKRAVSEVATEAAWYAVLDVHSKTPEKVNEAFKNFIDNHKNANYDPKAFLVSTLGYETANMHFK